MTNHKLPEYMVNGYQQFYQHYFVDNTKLYHELSLGQNPEILIICCCDSRIVPSVLFKLKPGQAFIVRNIGNIVGPYKETSTGGLATCSAIEYGIKVLGITQIVVLGHSQCGAIKGLVQNTHQNTHSFEFIDSWLQNHRKRLSHLFEEYQDSELYTKCEQESIVESIKNLKTFPWIADHVQITGLYFDIRTGKLLEMKNKMLD